MVGLAAGGGALISGIVQRPDEWVYRNNRVELLVDGRSARRKMLAALRRARSYIHLETQIIFAGDEVGRELADVLMERARTGVAVRMLYDAVGSFDGAAAIFAALRRAGVQLRERRGIHLTRPAGDTRLHTRGHRNVLVVDGRVAFTGGVDVSSAFGRRRSNPPAEVVGHTRVSVRGPAVSGFDRLFAESWRAQGGEITEPRAAMHDVPPEGDDVVQVMHARGGAGESICHAYLQAMGLAAERIWITQAHCAPERRFVETLRAASRRGVDVRLIAPGVSAASVVGQAARLRYGDLLRDGVRLYETPHAVLHANTAVIDGVWSTVGSSNLGYRSFLHDDEVNAVVLGPRFAGLMESQFLEDTKVAKAVLLKDWQYRPMYDRALGALCRAVEHWL